MRITIKQKENTTNEINTPSINLFVFPNICILNKLIVVCKTGNIFENREK